MKNLVYLCILILFSCHGGGTDGCPPDTFKGYIYNAPADVQWLPDPKIGKMVFKSNNGATGEFMVDKFYNRNYKRIPYPGCPDHYSYEMIDSLYCRSDRIFFTIEMTLYPSNPATLKIQIGSQYEYFIIKDSASYYSSDILLLDSMYLSTYKINVTPKDNNPLFLKSYYLQKGKGLVGFELVNNEVWARK